MAKTRQKLNCGREMAANRADTREMIGKAAGATFEGANVRKTSCCFRPPFCTHRLSIGTWRRRRLLLAKKWWSPRGVKGLAITLRAQKLGL